MNWKYVEEFPLPKDRPFIVAYAAMVCFCEWNEDSNHFKMITVDGDRFNCPLAHWLTHWDEIPISPNAGQIEEVKKDVLRRVMEMKNEKSIK